MEPVAIVTCEVETQTVDKTPETGEEADNASETYETNKACENNVQGEININFQSSTVPKVISSDIFSDP